MAEHFQLQLTSRPNTFLESAATKVVLEHRGFPQGTGAHLAEGWHLNYWQPLEKYLAQKGH